MARPDTTHLKTLLDSAKTVTLFLPQNPQYDAVAASLSLKLSFEPTGRSASVLCPDSMTVEYNRLVGVDSINSAFGSRQLIIGFPGQTEHVDKVSYNLDKGELQLVITPKVSAPDLDHRKLKFVAATSKPDLAILVGVHQLADLGHFYRQSGDFFRTTKLVSFTIDLPQENYTPYQIYDPEASSLSEIALHLIESLSLQLSLDAATNLFSGLEKATDNFRSPYVTNLTFDTAAKLMRRGARRHDVFKPENLPPGSVPQAPLQTPPPIPSSQLGYGTDSAQTSAPPVQPSPDWYEPKIYSGAMLP